MTGFLFNEIVFGPVISRRLGVSLGINLLPEGSKICNFDCIYCECGFNETEVKNRNLPSGADVKLAVEEKFMKLKAAHDSPDSITFAGNGEPTLHPEFPEIVDDLTGLRNLYFPKAVISLLSNGSTIHRPEIFKTLQKLDNNILKLDAGTEEMFRKLNRYHGTATLHDFVDQLCRFNGNLIIQTMFVKGYFKGELIDNTIPGEIDPWLEYIRRIHPKSVMVYSVARPTPAQELTKVPKAELEWIAGKVRELGIEVNVY